MKVILTPEHIATTAGKEILEPAVRTTLDGKLDLPEIKDLRRWLRANQADTSMPAMKNCPKPDTRWCPVDMGFPDESGRGDAQDTPN